MVATITGRNPLTIPGGGREGEGEGGEGGREGGRDGGGRDGGRERLRREWEYKEQNRRANVKRERDYKY